jgi:hypothetical protein
MELTLTLPEDLQERLKRIEENQQLLLKLIQPQKSSVIPQSDDIFIEEALFLIPHLNSKSSLYKTSIPRRKLGKRIVFSRADILAWVQNQIRNPEREPVENLQKSANKKNHHGNK